MTRRATEKQARHDEILNAAELVFFQKGYEHSSMEEIAQAAGLSRALLYVYFKDKAAIMRGIMLRAARSIERRFELVLQRYSTGMEQIEGIGHAYYEFSTAEPDYFDVLTSANTFPLPDSHDSQLDELGSCRARITGLMVQALENGLQDATLDPLQVRDTERTASFLQGALHGVIMQARTARGRTASYPESRELIHYTIRMLTKAISRDRAR